VGGKNPGGGGDVSGGKGTKNQNSSKRHKGKRTAYDARKGFFQGKGEAQKKKSFSSQEKSRAWEGNKKINGWQRKEGKPKECRKWGGEENGSLKGNVFLKKKG